MRYFLSVVLCLVLISCVQEKLEREEFIKWCDQNLMVSQEVGKIKFDVKLLPEEYFETQKNTPLALKNHRTVYALMKIQTKEGEESLWGKYGSEEFTKNINYFIENAKRDYRLICDNDTFNPVLYHFERYFNITNYSIVNLAFEIPKEAQIYRCKLEYNDQKLNVGKMIFPVKKFNSQTLPQII